MTLSPRTILGFRIAQLVAGLALLALAWHTGKARIALLAYGERTPGVIVDFRQRSFSSRGAGNLEMNTSGFLPVVQFAAGDRVVRFSDWLGSSSKGRVGESVPVLYLPSDPATAIIDRPLGNWLPWGGIGAVGAFLFVVSVGGWLRTRMAA